MFRFILCWFLLTGQGLYCFTSLTSSSLPCMVCVVSLHASLVRHYWALLALFHLCASLFFPSSAWFLFFHFPHWFILLCMICIVSFHASVVVTYWAWSVLFHFMPYWFIITGHGMYCYTSCFSCSYLLGMVSHASLIHHYRAWLVLFELMLRWSFLTFYYFSLSFIGSSLLGMICIVSLSSLVHPYHIFRTYGIQRWY